MAKVWAALVASAGSEGSDGSEDPEALACMTARVRNAGAIKKARATKKVKASKMARASKRADRSTLVRATSTFKDMTAEASTASEGRKAEVDTAFEAVRMDPAEASAGRTAAAAEDSMTAAATASKASVDNKFRVADSSSEDSLVEDCSTSTSGSAASNSFWACLEAEGSVGSIKARTEA